MSNRSRHTLLTISLLVLIDWASKFAVRLFSGDVASATPILFQHSWGPLSFHIWPTFNEGAAFGLFSSYKYGLLALRILVILAVLIFLIFKSQSCRPATRLSLTLICSGAIGNVVDFLFYRRVTDFFSVSYKNWYFPTFNCADTFIFFGSLIFLYTLYFPTKQKGNKG